MRLETPELKQAKKEISRLAQQLEQRVAERTSQLQTANEALHKEIGERRTIEDSLRKSEKQFRELVESLPAVVYHCDSSGNILQYNRQAVELWGRPPDPGESGERFCSALRLYRPDGTRLPYADSPMAEALRSGKPVRNIELAVERPDGTIAIVMANIAPIADEHEKTVGAVNCLIDITELKRAETDLRKQKEILQKVFDHIPVMINLTGPDGRIEMVNREWERVLGWSLEEIQARDVDMFAECYPDPKYRAVAMDFISAATGEWADFITRVRDGRILQTSWAEVRLSDGTTIGFGTDITDRKRAEDALRESEEKFRQLAENVREVFWMNTPDFRNVLYVSPAFEAVWGRSRETVYNDMQSMIDAVHPDDRPYIEAFIQQRRETAFELEYRIIKPDGLVRWIWDRGFPIKDRSGRVYRLVGLAGALKQQHRARRSNHQRAVACSFGKARVGERGGRGAHRTRAAR